MCIINSKLVLQILEQELLVEVKDLRATVATQERRIKELETKNVRAGNTAIIISSCMPTTE